MAGDFGRFLNEKRKGRGEGGKDILLRDIAEAMGVTTLSYVSDILKGRRNPPSKELLNAIADLFKMTPQERAEMFDIAGKERKSAAPVDIGEYIMDDNMPHVRAALRRASRKGLDDNFWKRIYDEIGNGEK